MKLFEKESEFPTYRFLSAEPSNLPLSPSPLTNESQPTERRDTVLEHLPDLQSTVQSSSTERRIQPMMTLRWIDETNSFSQ